MVVRLKQHGKISEETESIQLLLLKITEAMLLIVIPIYILPIFRA